MRRPLCCALAILMPSAALGLDWSADTGYTRYSFSGDEQLGATSPTRSLHLSTGHGPTISASAGLHTPHLALSLRAEAAYLFMSGQPAQPYVVKGRSINTSSLAGSLVTADLVAGIRAQSYRVELAGGVATMGIGERWSRPFDFDTGFHGAVSLTFAHKGVDVTVTGDLLMLPSVVSRGDLTPAIGWNVTFGKAAEPSVSAAPPTLPMDPTPVVPEVTEIAALPQPITPTTPEERMDRAVDKSVDGVVRVLLSNPRMAVEVRIRSANNPRAVEAAERFKRQVMDRGIAEVRIRMAVTDDGKFDPKHLVRFVFLVITP